MKPSNSILIFLLHLILMPSFALDPYQTLGVSPSASDEEIKKAYLSKVRTAHPDTSSLPKVEAEKQFKAIQIAWEHIQKLRSHHTRVDLEKAQAKRDAKDILEKALANDQFGPATIQSLPRFQASHKKSPFPSARSSKDEGEWEAIEEFLKSHGQFILNSRLSETELNSLMRTLDEYAELTGKAVQAIRGGITEAFEDKILETTNDRSFFVSALKERLDRFYRSGVYHLAGASAEERKQSLSRIIELYSRKFGEEPSTSGSKLSQELLDHSFEVVSKSPSRSHELGSILRAIPAALAPKEALTFLGNFLEKLELLSKQTSNSGSYKALQERAERTVERIFEKNPELKKDYVNKTSFWKRFITQIPQCDRILGSIARTAP